MKTATTWALIGGAVAVLTACGGGSTEPAAPVTPSSVTIGGTAAKGLALAGATVSVKCATGTGTATTAANGSYSLTITGAALPCALRVVGTEGSTFHSLLSGGASTGSFTANLTPLTDLLVARAAGAVPATFYAGFVAASAPSASAVTQALADLRTMVAGVVDLTAVNPISDALVAANGSNAGNALDQKIDQLMAALTKAQTTVAELSAAIASNPTATDPIKTVLQPAATACAWLRSGKYRMINPNETDPLLKGNVLDLNAATLSAKNPDNSIATMTSDGGCQFTHSELGATNKVMVSSAGVLVVHSQSTTNVNTRGVTIGLPEQTLPVSEFAGTWNIAHWDPTSGISTPGYVADTQELVINSTGQVTSFTRCVGLAPCPAPSTSALRFVANTSSGGFDLVEGGANKGRVYLFKSVAGKAVFVFVGNGPDRDFGIGSTKETLGALPAMGSVSNFREFQFNGNGSIGALAENTNTVTAVDTVANSFTRRRTADGRVDTLGVNKPRNGLRYRAANSCTVNGVASNCSETVQLPLQGMGITLSLSVGNSPTSAFLNVAVIKP